MTAVTEMGGIIFPPLPAFYLGLTSIDDLVDETIERVLTLVGVTAATPRAWTGL
jgi:4-hydroxy-3-polyprenylbenzoate decarboxylase